MKHKEIEDQRRSAMKISIHSSSPEMAKGFLALAHPADGSSGPPPLIEIDGVQHYTDHVNVDHEKACITLEMTRK